LDSYMVFMDTEYALNVKNIPGTVILDFIPIVIGWFFPDIEH